MGGQQLLSSGSGSLPGGITCVIRFQNLPGRWAPRTLGLGAPWRAGPGIWPMKFPDAGIRLLLLLSPLLWGVSASVGLSGAPTDP